MFCNKCGKKLKDDVKFCTACGNKLPADFGGVHTNSEKKQQTVISAPKTEERSQQAADSVPRPEEKQRQAVDYEPPAGAAAKKTSKGKILVSIFMLIAVTAIGAAVYFTLPWLDDDEKIAYNTTETFLSDLSGGRVGTAAKRMEFYHILEENRALLSLLTLGKSGATEETIVQVMDSVGMNIFDGNIEVLRLKKRYRTGKDSVEFVMKVKEDDLKAELSVALVRYSGQWYISKITDPKTGNTISFSEDDIMKYINEKGVEAGAKIEDYISGKTEDVKNKIDGYISEKTEDKKIK